MSVKLISVHDFTFDAMALRVTFIFICTGLTGIQSISTVGHVAVEVGGTVHIPCKYEDKYRINTKYLCWGYNWNFCTIQIRSDQKNSSKYSINDDKRQRIVTFTVKNLELNGDSRYYWCAVEISRAADDGERFQLSVTKKGESKLYVDSQWTTGHFDRVNIYCKYRGSGPKQWCRVGGPCSTSGQIDGALVTTDTSASGVFAVTMTGLFQRNIGWYWCSSGALQMPVFLHLTERPNTSTIGTTTTSSAANTEPTPRKKSVSDYITAAAIALGSLTFIVVVSVVVWFVLKRNVKNTEGPQTEKDQEVVYRDIIIHSQLSSNRKKDEPLEMSVIYSTIETQGKSQQMAGPAEGSVIYSTVSK